MKKTLAVLTIFILFTTSCKKSRTCNCKVTTSGTTTTRTQTPGIPPLVPQTDTTVTIPLNTYNENATTFQKVTKRKAKYNCFGKTENINESTSNGVPGLVTITTTNEGTRVYDCELK